MAAHQAPPSLGFSRQEHWTGLPFPSPLQESESEAAQSCPTLSDPTDCSLPGSSIHGIFQARVLEWGAIAFSVFLVWYLEKIEEGKLYAWVSASSGKGEAFIASTRFSYLVLDKCFLKSSVQTSSCVSLTMQILIQRV